MFLSIVLYFFFGGLAGRSFLVSTIASLLGFEKDGSIVRVGRYLSLASILISTILLIKDLGRPERFLHMLRVLKLRSVMSICTWALSTSGISLILSLSSGNRRSNSLERLEQTEIIAATTELGIITALAPSLGSLGKPLFKGRNGLLLLGGIVGSGLVAPLLLRLIWKIARKSTPREVNIVASLLVLAGGLILRYVWNDAGRKSADDPQATHFYNRIEWEQRK